MLNLVLSTKLMGSFSQSKRTFDTRLHGLCVINPCSHLHVFVCLQSLQVTTLALLAEAQVACQEYGAAVSSATEALELDGRCCTALVARATARAWRREYEVSQSTRTHASGLSVAYM